MQTLLRLAYSIDTVACVSSQLSCKIRDANVTSDAMYPFVDLSKQTSYAYTSLLNICPYQAPVCNSQPRCLNEAAVINVSSHYKCQARALYLALASCTCVSAVTGAPALLSLPSAILRALPHRPLHVYTPPPPQAPTICSAANCVNLAGWPCT